MSYHYSYGFEDGREEEGDDFASGGGWAAFVDFVVEETDGLEACDLLALEGWAMLDEVKAELPKLRERMKYSPDLQHITDRLIEACEAAPEGCTVLMIGDGIEGDDEDEDDEEE